VNARPLGTWVALAVKVGALLFGTGIIFLGSLFSPAPSEHLFFGGIMLGGIAIGWVLFPLIRGSITESDRESDYLPFQLPVLGGVVVMAPIMNLLMPRHEPADSTWREWLQHNLASGQLSFLVSGVIYGLHLCWKGSEPARLEPEGVKALARCQGVIYSLTFLTLTLGYRYAEPKSVVFAVLSWCIFFIIDDWLIIEHYVLEEKGTLNWTHFFRLAGANALLITLMLLAWLGYINPMLHQLAYQRDPYTYEQILFGVGFCIVGLGGTLLSFYLLYLFTEEPHMRED
jgi:hypothetical protein